MREKIKFSLLRLRLYLGLLKRNKGRLFITLSGYESYRKKFYPDFKKNKKIYVNDVQRSLLHTINKKNQQVFSQLNSYFIFKDFINYANIYGVILDGEFISYNDKISSVNLILDLDKFVIKAIDGAGGKNVFIIEKLKNDSYKVNKEVYDKENLLKLIETLNKYIIQEFVYQHKELSNIYSKSSNTLRLVTTRVKDSNMINVVAGVLRIGNEQSKPVDNFSSRGFSFKIDLLNGETYNGKRYNYIEKKIETITKHPDSNLLIKGFNIPHFNKIKEDLTRTHKSLPELNIIAWDILITNESYKIIEVNNTTDVDIFQIHGDLLNTNDINEFLKYHKIK